jgi:NADH:ubiquinone reductase (H+-translocating)
MNSEVLNTAPKIRVLILGGGFGGFYAALHLDKTIAADPNIEVTVVSRENFILFTPMLHEVAAGDLDDSDIAGPLREMLKHAHFLEAQVEAIDLAKQQVTVTYGAYSQKKQLSYDHLLIALGSETNFFKLPGVEERAVTMKSIGDAFLLRNVMLLMLELASLTEDISVRRALLTFVVAGGGFAGVETIGALNDFVREALRFYPNLTEADLRVMLIHADDVILPELGERLGRYAQKKLAARKVEIRTKTRVAGFSDHGVELGTGETIAAQTLVWTAGVTPPAVLRNLPCKTEKGRIVVEETLEVPGFPGVWAVGDCAWVPNPRTGKPHPPTAQHALRQAVRGAKNIVAAIRGRQKTPFAFTTLGQLAAIGRHTGVASILGIQLSGLPAFFLWRTIYLAKLPSFEKKLRVLLNWILDLFFTKNFVQILTLQRLDHIAGRLAYIRQHPTIPVLGRPDALPGSVPVENSLTIQDAERFNNQSSNEKSSLKSE